MRTCRWISLNWYISNLNKVVTNLTNAQQLTVSSHSVSLCKFDTWLWYLCDSPFEGRRSDLVRHLRIHTNERQVLQKANQWTWIFTFWLTNIDLTSVMNRTVAKVSSRYVQQMSFPSALSFTNCSPDVLFFSDPLWKCICEPIPAKDLIHVKLRTVVKASATVAL